MENNKRFLWDYYKKRGKENKEEQLKLMREELLTEFHDICLLE